MSALYGNSEDFHTKTTSSFKEPYDPGDIYIDLAITKFSENLTFRIDNYTKFIEGKIKTSSGKKEHILVKDTSKEWAEPLQVFQSLPSGRFFKHRMGVLSELAEQMICFKTEKYYPLLIFDDLSLVDNGYLSLKTSEKIDQIHENQEEYWCKTKQDWVKKKLSKKQFEHEEYKLLQKDYRLYKDCLNPFTGYNKKSAFFVTKDNINHMVTFSVENSQNIITYTDLSKNEFREETEALPEVTLGEYIHIEEDDPELGLYKKDCECDSCKKLKVQSFKVVLIESEEDYDYRLEAKRKVREAFKSAQLNLVDDYKNQVMDFGLNQMNFSLNKDYIDKSQEKLIEEPIENILKLEIKIFKEEGVENIPEHYEGKKLISLIDGRVQEVPVLSE